MRISIRIGAIISVLVLFGVAFYPAGVRASGIEPLVGGSPDPEIIIGSNLSEIVEELIDATSDMTDTDGDGLPDSVERVIGTDYENDDSDFDQLDDYYEAQNDLDPMKPDSNLDGLPDYYEVNEVDLDVDGDGIVNAWDFDNDNDGVNDGVDLSQYAQSTVNDRFYFDIKTNGNPTYINFQLRPEDPQHLNLFGQTWDWPLDAEPPMIDMDNSKDDLEIMPTLELNIPVDYKIVAKHSGKVLDVSGASQIDGANIIQYTYRGQDNQLWTLEPAWMGYYYIIAKHSGKVMDVRAAGQDDGVNVIQYTKGTQENQLWKLQEAGDGYYVLMAKHSMKCLEVSGASQANSANVEQSTCDYRDNQLWKLEPSEDVIPEQSEVANYGITVALNKVHVPLVPVVEYGSVVALGGRMFYPASSPLDLSVTMKLYWVVNGNTDTRPVKAFKGDNKKYFKLKADDTLASISNTIDDSEKFEWIDLTRTKWDIWPFGKIAIKAPNGKYLSAQSDGTIIANGHDIGDQETFKGFYLASLGIDKWVLIANNGKYLSVGADGSVRATSSSIGDQEMFDVLQVEYIKNQIPLVRYRENFKLTGLSFEESQGFDAGVFYSEDIGQVIMAGITTDYTFLRNSTYDLSDMPEVLLDHNVDVTSDIRSFSHEHEALLAISSEMTLDALNSLPDGRKFPVLIAFEDNFVRIEMDKLDPGTYIMGDTYEVDMTSEPIMTARSMKMIWFDTDNNVALDVEEVTYEMEQWCQHQGLDSDTTDTLVKLAIAWDVGEAVVIGIGDVKFDFESPEIPVVLASIGYGAKGLAALCKTITRVKATYQWIKMATAARSIRSIPSVRATFHSVLNSNTRFINIVNKIGKAFGIIAVIIIAITAFYAYLTIQEDLGGNFGHYVGALYATMIIAYAAILFAIAKIPYVGVAIVVAIVLSDILTQLLGHGSWTQKIMEGIIDWVTDINTRTKVDIEMGNSEVAINDIDDNGLDVGDSVAFVSRITENVTLTKDGEFGDLYKSYIISNYRIEPPPGHSQLTDSGRKAISTSIGSSYLAKESELYVAIIPDIAMINFPFVFWLEYEYKVVYERCYWIFGWECDVEIKTGSGETDKSTFYLDVLPGSLNDFLNWKEINANDHDGDGILDRDEINTDPWKWDSDSDGVNDKFEEDFGSDPNSYDTDMDGMGDYLEYVYGTDPSNWDTDGDRLSDYFELEPWPISFDYDGHSFVWSVRSNPLLNDTDGDGLDDQVEYWSDLNPNSNDTNGDGILDVLNIKYIKEIQYDSEWGNEGSEDGEFNMEYGIAADSSGNVYVSDVGNFRVQKFDSNGDFVTKWGSQGNSNGQFNYSYGLDVSPDGYVYVADTFNHRIQKFDSNGNFERAWGSFGPFPPPADPPGGVFYAPYDVAVDDGNDYVYVADLGVHRIQKFNSNGGFIRKWGSFGSGPGQFQHPTTVAVAPDGSVYVGDSGNERIQKFNSDGGYIKSIYAPGYLHFDFTTGLEVDYDGNLYITDGVEDRVQQYDSDGGFITAWGTAGTGPGEFDLPWDVTVDPSGNMYVSDARNHRIQKFVEVAEPDPPDIPDSLPDADGDGLLNEHEELGWFITVFNSTGVYTVHVTSDPLLEDTDYDGFTDYEELNLSPMMSNPSNPDTDSDGLSDYEEVMLGTYVAYYDSDFDGLDDGTELQFGSDPMEPDGDGDGLSDYAEFQLGSNPNSLDTDDDGLTDYEENLHGSNLVNPDSDSDLLFDDQEQISGTNPQDSDHDDDGLSDGYESLYDTDPKNNDTDGDSVLDGEETERHMNPHSNDTDDDGLLDSEELEMGTNPLNEDSDGDGVLDSEDSDSGAEHTDHLILAYDPDTEVDEFIDNLEDYTNVITVTAEELLANYTDDPHIVLVGRPEAGSGMVGNIIYDLLEDTGDVLTDMESFDEYRTAVRHGVWTPLQTVVMISHPYPSDHFRVLNTLRTNNVTVLPDTVTVEYLAPKQFFMVDEIDTVKELDASILIALEEETIPYVELNEYDDSTAPAELTRETGLAKYEYSLGQYLEIGLTGDNDSEVLVESAEVKMYYTFADLDTDGNGIVEVPDDMNESTLGLYVYDETTGMWSKLSEDMDWVVDTGVNTTNIEVYGTSYEGYLWATVTHLSLYAIGGLPLNTPPEVEDAFPSIEFLWSPNHKFVDITIEGVWDLDNDPITITILNITSDEPTSSVGGAGGAKHAPDAYGIGTSTASLRAERSAKGNGRVYVITFMASDGRGGESIGTVAVYVPLNQGKDGYICIDDGQNYDATEIN